MAIIHKPFNYVPSLHTNIAKTIQRERKRLKALEQAGKAEVPAEVVVTNVTPLPTGKLRSGKG